MTQVPLDENILPGETITTAAHKALELLATYGEQNVEVVFTFNDTKVVVTKGDSPVSIVARWKSDMKAAHEAYINSQEYKDREAKHVEDDKRERAAVMVETATTEAQMRDAKVPWPKTEKQLMEYIGSLVNRDHDYGTAVYAISMAATAAFNYVCGAEGCTGFQASCADMDVLRRTRLIDGPFMIIKGEDALYPQYDLPGKLDEALDKWKPWFKEEAAKKLAENAGAHPAVIEHWKKLAGDNGETLI